MVVLPADHSPGVAGGRGHPQVDARSDRTPLRVGADLLRDPGAPVAVAAQPESDGVAAAHAGGGAAAQGRPGALQGQSREAPEGNDADLQGVQRQSAGWLPADVPAASGAVALFFVFANTIEFRGVPFLWLPDLSRADPYFIIPVVMGLSMFAVSKVGQIGMPPNPQTKMLLYFMPAFLTFVFLRFASGLNLYYTVQNLVSIPQQYFLAKRRLREQGKK